MRVVVRGKRNPRHLSIGQRLKQLRKAAGLTRNQLAEMAATSMGYGIEQGRIPGIDVAEALALALGASPCWLAFGVDLPFSAEAPQAAGIAARLVAARQARGMDKAALAKESELARGTVLYIETGKVIPSIATGERLAGALRVSPCWLCFGEGPRDRPPPVRRTSSVRPTGPTETSDDPPAG